MRSICAAWERGDWSSAGWADPYIEFVIADGPETRATHGATAMTDAWREFLAAWAGYNVQAEQFRDLGDERVLVLLHAGGHGKLSGVKLGQTGGKGANVFTIADSRVARLAIYFDHTRALADLGLTPDTDA